ncbi:hypothetical protein E1176_00880, partial [Fulvivirga sp. RKSG066]|uniref:lipocalin family protein n=1 Tax=Fulvivirga aurantia TaxID=2529383 RepID=UPI0012BD16F7
FLTACEDEEDTKVSLETQLVGTWQSITLERMNCSSPDSEGSISLDCPDFCLTLVFNSDGTSEDSYKDPNDQEAVVSTGSYSVSGSELTTCYDNECETSSFQIAGDVLVITSVGEDTGCTLKLTLNRI